MINCSNKTCLNELPRLSMADVNIDDVYCSDCADLFNYFLELEIVELNLFTKEITEC